MGIALLRERLHVAPNPFVGLQAEVADRQCHRVILCNGMQIIQIGHIIADILRYHCRQRYFMESLHWKALSVCHYKAINTSGESVKS
jgi:hypothetical protein